MSKKRLFLIESNFSYNNRNNALKISFDPEINSPNLYFPESYCR